MNVVAENKFLPLLRFSEFEDEWKHQSLGKLTIKVNQKNKANISYPIYSINNIEGFIPQSEQFDGLDSNVRKYDISIYKIVQPKTFAYNPARINIGSIGYNYDLKDIIISSLYICFQTNDNLDDSYLRMYFKTYNFNMDILKYQEGGVRQYLFYENFSMIKIPLPSLIEQKKIASFLSSVDDKIQKLNRKKELLKEYKKGVMQKIFSQELRFKDDNGNNYPEWRENNVDNLFRLISHTAISKKDIINNGKHVVIEQGKKQDLGFSNDTSKLIKSNGLVLYGDHTTMIKYISFDFIPGVGIKILESKKDDDLVYLYYNLSYNNIKPEGYKRHFSIVRLVCLQLPCLSEQQKIANFLSSIDKKIDLVSNQLENTKVFKKGLLQQMFV